MNIFNFLSALFGNKCDIKSLLPNIVDKRLKIFILNFLLFLFHYNIIFRLDMFHSSISINKVMYEYKTVYITKLDFSIMLKSIFYLFHSELLCMLLYVQPTLSKNQQQNNQKQKLYKFQTLQLKSGFNQNFGRFWKIFEFWKRT